MTILKGDHYQVETLAQFIEYTDFTQKDVVEVLQNEGTYDFVDTLNEEIKDEGLEPIEGVNEMTEDEAEDLLGAFNVSAYEAIQPVLEEDWRDWVHLFDSHVHDIVEIYDDE